MSATSTIRKISRVDSRLGVLNPWIERLEEARGEVLLRLPDGSDTSLSASKIRSELSQIEYGLRGSVQVFVTAADVCEGLTSRRLPGLNAAREEVELLSEQRAALEATLPSPEDVAQAEVKTEQLVKRVSKQRALFAKSWSAFVNALTEAEVAARQVAAIRSEAQAAILEMRQLREVYALEIEVPGELNASSVESKLAGHLATLLRNVGYRQVIDQQFDAEVASARGLVEREAT